MTTIETQIEYHAHTSVLDDLRFIWENEEFDRSLAKATVTDVHASFTATRLGWDLTLEMSYNKDELLRLARDFETPPKTWREDCLSETKWALENLGLEVTGASKLTKEYYILDGIIPANH